MDTPPYELTMSCMLLSEPLGTLRRPHFASLGVTMALFFVFLEKGTQKDQVHPILSKKVPGFFDCGVVAIYVYRQERGMIGLYIYISFLHF